MLASSLRAALLALLALPVGGGPTPAPLPDRALELRNLGLAQLENEQPAQAEATFRELAKIAAGDPLPDADLAIATLRQQKNAEALEWIDRALAKAPGRADLVAIRGDVQQWSGHPEEALALYRQAAAADPDRLDVHFQLYQQASALGDDPAARAALDEALAALVRLRPENLVVLLKEGQRAIRAGDRAAATQAFLRVRELLWQAPPQAAASLDQVLQALETAGAGSLEPARLPAVRLENVLKITPLYKQSLSELAPGIQGMPVERFAAEPPVATFGDPLPVVFRSTGLGAGATAGRALAIGDFDGDGKPDVARIVAPLPASDAPPRLEIRRAAAPEPAAGPQARGIAGLLAADLDNDGHEDLIGYGPSRAIFWRGKGDGGFEDATAAAGLTRGGGDAAAALDFDIEGDLDLVLAGGDAGGELYRNNLAGPLEPIGAQALPRELPGAGARALVVSDLDRDGDLDLAVAHAQGIAWLDNLRQGRFGDRTAAAGLGRAAPAEALVSADLDNDGLPDLVAAGASGLAAWHNRGGRFEPWPLPGLPVGKELTALVAFDADNDGRLDLAAAGPGGVLVLGQRGTIAGPRFEPLAVEGASTSAAVLAASDLDGDGDLDLLAAGPTGLWRLDNDGGNKNHWLTVRLHALIQGSGKNNVEGRGSSVELRAGAAYQLREADGPAIHFGLGRRTQADLLRVTWTSGVPQNRIQPRGDERIVEEQLLKGSCPFLYAWDGRRFAFVTDLLWGAPAGLPVAPGVFAGSDPDELVRVDGAEPRDGRYELRITEELWEAAFFDGVKLWVVDHPAGVEVASSLRVVPGETIPERVLASRAVRPVAAAQDGEGKDVTARVRARDEVYASGFAPSAYQGVAARPWSFTFDLGSVPATPATPATPAAPVRLLLDAWIFPADASLNLAVAQRPDLPPVFPRLEVETATGWRVLMPNMGFPAGKTKTMVVDTPPLPPGAHRLRIVTNLWLGWDRIAWTDTPADGEVRLVGKLDPSAADLRYRGFSARLRRSPNGPHGVDYDRVTTSSPWLPFPGHYTRYGDVRALLRDADDRSAILAPGDEIAVTFDASGLPPVPAGWRRTVFLQSHGWDKDADRNTWEAQRMEPLPFREMKRYGDPFPDTPELRRYVEEWLTREIPGGR
jgi:tetratricopeptide (TPR) repeat protein